MRWIWIFSLVLCLFAVPVLAGVTKTHTYQTQHETVLESTASCSGTYAAGRTRTVESRSRTRTRHSGGSTGSYAGSHGTVPQQIVKRTKTKTVVRSGSSSLGN